MTNPCIYLSQVLGVPWAECPAKQKQKSINLFPCVTYAVPNFPVYAQMRGKGGGVSLGTI